MNQPSDVAGKIRAFVLGHFPLAQQRQLADNASLIEEGIVDSLGILEVVTFIESEFALTLSDDEMVSENFDSICSLAAFVASKLAASQQVPAEP